MESVGTSWAGADLRRYRDLVATRWRNHGGWTREVVSVPATATPDAAAPVAPPCAGWRLSIASIVTDGPFSAFPGLDRTFVVAGEVGVSLSVDARRHDLEPGGVLGFTGEADVRAEVGALAATAVNLMTDRAHCRGEVSVRVLDGADVVVGAAAVVLLRGTATAADCSELAALDSIVGSGGPLDLHGDQALLAVVRLFPVGESPWAAAVR